MAEKMTVSVFAMLHGDVRALAETHTWEAETREDLAAMFAAFLRKTADDIEGVVRP